MSNNRHWTSSTLDDFAYWVSSDFTAQIEAKLEAKGIDQNTLAERLNVSPSYVSQVLNNPGNLTLETVIKYSRALGMKVALVTYEDNDPDNEKGPIPAELFTACWERLGSPRDFFDMQSASTSDREWIVYVNTQPTVSRTRIRKPLKVRDNAATSNQLLLGRQYA